MPTQKRKEERITHEMYGNPVRIASQFPEVVLRRTTKSSAE